MSQAFFPGLAGAAGEDKHDPALLTQASAGEYTKNGMFLSKQNKSC